MANLEEAHLEEARYNQATRWAEGFDPKVKGAIHIE